MDNKVNHLTIIEGLVAALTGLLKYLDTITPPQWLASNLRTDYHLSHFNLSPEMERVLFYDLIERFPAWLTGGEGNSWWLDLYLEHDKLMDEQRGYVTVFFTTAFTPEMFLQWRATNELA
jgi:hypothetical protein